MVGRSIGIPQDQCLSRSIDFVKRFDEGSLSSLSNAEQGFQSELLEKGGKLSATYLRIVATSHRTDASSKFWKVWMVPPTPLDPLALGFAVISIC
jgi:hypothetical protein